MKLSPGELLVDIAAAAVKRIRNRPKAVARRAAKTARKAKHGGPQPDDSGEFFTEEPEGSMLQGKLTHTGAGVAASSPLVGIVVNAFVPHVENAIASVGFAPFMCAPEATNCISAGQLAVVLISGLVAVVGGWIASYGRSRAEKRHAAELEAAKVAGAK